MQQQQRQESGPITSTATRDHNTPRPGAGDSTDGDGRALGPAAEGVGEVERSSPQAVADPLVQDLPIGDVLDEDADELDVIGDLAVGRLVVDGPDGPQSDDRSDAVRAEFLPARGGGRRRRRARSARSGRPGAAPGAGTCAVSRQHHQVRGSPTGLSRLVLRDYDLRLLVRRSANARKIPKLPNNMPPPPNRPRSLTGRWIGSVDARQTAVTPITARPTAIANGIACGPRSICSDKGSAFPRITLPARIRHNRPRTAVLKNTAMLRPLAKRATPVTTSDTPGTAITIAPSRVVRIFIDGLYESIGREGPKKSVSW